MKLIISHSKEIISAIIAGVIIAIISTLILDFIYAETGPDETVVSMESTQAASAVPQLWSHHKFLEISADECSNNALSILNELGFNSVIKNKLYVYGNRNGNRAAIKCVNMGGNSFVYAAVAGADVTLVEKLRNEIAWKL
ncbi:hypothetical protein [Thalassomonas sp. RHCl1]|uniref:hypothetical protein n=1 Tax=Thalassomonas sp. RHCl1 TaxID=2995320 RepID=UPI00248BCDD5|nr:hypothetical protein [Thalassomonas sp. RHCl1]